MDWSHKYEELLVSPEEAVQVVESGDLVLFAMGREPNGLGLALAARKEELNNVRICVPFAARDFGWYDPGWDDSFNVEASYIMPIVSNMMREKRCDYVIGTLAWQHYWDNGQTDILMLEVGPPNKQGYCSLGASCWHKKWQIKNAMKVLAEVNPAVIKTYGDNSVHISEIDVLVRHVASGREISTGDMTGKSMRGPSKADTKIAEYVGSLVQDGDTIEIGAGGTSEWIPMLGVFDNKNDLGLHTEVCPPGIIDLVKNGVITGKHKTVHQGKAVCTAVGGTRQHLDFVNENPAFELYDASYVLDPRVIAAHDNMVAINSSVSVDLTGQINTESIGATMIAGSGGQPAFAIGASLSKGGKYIVALPSTAVNGKVSRISAQFPEGSVVGVPRILTDYVVTEYGIAQLKGHTQRRRAEALIAIAHPDFRAGLEREAQRLFWQ